MVLVCHVILEDLVFKESSDFLGAAHDNSPPCQF